MLQGQDLLANLVGMPLRFREKKVGIAADIEKAFLQIGLQEKDRDVTRFFWIKDIGNPHISQENIQVYRFRRVPFGIISSPFMLMATVQHHLKKALSTASELIRLNIYMDNVLVGADSTEEGKAFYKESKETFQNASMNLREWTTNDKALMEQIPDDDKVRGIRVKALGLVWDLQEDTLSISGTEKLSEVVITTRRDMLKSAAKIFDPLGLFAPATLRLKKLMRQVLSSKNSETSQTKLGWDDKLSEEVIQQWKELLVDLNEISIVKLKRWLSLRDRSSCKLICFTDASKEAYGAVVYLQFENESETKVEMIFAKSRLAPLKEVSIPRLELLGVLTGVRLLEFLENQLMLPILEKILFTDSQCVIGWIKSGKDLGTFVENRIREIRSKGEKVVFRYVRTDENPADLVSRGCSVKELNESIWWHGPDWLKLPQKKWSANEMAPVTESVWKQKELERGASQIMSFGEREKQKGETSLVVGRTLKGANPEMQNWIGPFGLKTENFSKIYPLLKRTAWLNRVVNKMRKKTSLNGNITAEEIRRARLQWNLLVQKQYFGNELEVLHSGTSQTLAQLRMNHWNPKGRTAVRTVLEKCLVCKRTEGGPFQAPDMPSWPEFRVKAAPAFAWTGLDYLGPLFVKVAEKEVKKIWVCLFTCLVTRAVHLEIQ